MTKKTSIYPKQITLMVGFLVLLSPLLISWSSPIHQAMTSVAIQLLPQAQIEVWKPYRKNFIADYCLIPDITRKDAKSAYSPYVNSFLDSHQFTDISDDKKPLMLHLGDKEVNNIKVYTYYTNMVYEKLKGGETEEALKYLGTFLHYVQDSSCPAHFRYSSFSYPRGEGRTPHFGSLHFFKRFMSVPEKYQDARLHSMIDKGGFDEAELSKRVARYKPQMLGNSIPALIEALQQRHEEMMATSEKMLIPMLQARFNDDEKEFANCGLNAAEPSVKLSADFMYTLLQLCKP